MIFSIKFINFYFIYVFIKKLEEDIFKWLYVVSKLYIEL